MDRSQKLVRDFNRAIQTDRRETPGIPSAENRLLRATLILGEAIETVRALGFCLLVGDSKHEITSEKDISFREGSEPNLVEIIDGLADCNYVNYGTADAIGVDLEPFYEEVHFTNMQKLNGPKDANGKQLKPEGWKPPRIGEMLKSIDGVFQDRQNDTLSAYLLRTK